MQTIRRRPHPGLATQAFVMEEYRLLVTTTVLRVKGFLCVVTRQSEGSGVTNIGRDEHEAEVGNA